tara:strand:+ start:2156 stop:2533 length:378 start_codon:yes stop_codon:yes gene_type:complete
VARIYLSIIIIGVISGIGYGAYAYYSNTQERLKQLQENNAKLEVSVQSLEKVKNTLEEDAQKQANQVTSLIVKLEKAEKEQDELRAKLNKHDLTRLSEKKPGLIEKRINDGTKKLFTDFESITAK